MVSTALPPPVYASWRWQHHLICNWENPPTESTTGLYWQGLTCEIRTAGTCLILSWPPVYISFVLLHDPWNHKQYNLECTRSACEWCWRRTSSSQFCSREPQQQAPAVERTKLKNPLWRTKSLSSHWPPWEAAFAQKHLTSFQELGSPIS